jgi:hypothetical protein
MMRPSTGHLVAEELELDCQVWWNQSIKACFLAWSCQIEYGDWTGFRGLSYTPRPLAILG